MNASISQHWFKLMIDIKCPLVKLKCWLALIYNYTEPETFEKMCGLLKGTFIPENKDVKNLKMHSPENDDYNLKIDENGVLHNVPYLDYDTKK